MADPSRRKLLSDTRVRVKSLQLLPFGSEDWIGQLETSLKPLATLAMSEETAYIQTPRSPTSFSVQTGLPPLWAPLGTTAANHPGAGLDASGVEAAMSGSFDSPGRRPPGPAVVGIVSENSTVWERGDVVARVVIEESRTATVLRVYIALADGIVSAIQLRGATGVANTTVDSSFFVTLSNADRMREGALVVQQEAWGCLVALNTVLRWVVQTVEAAQTVDMQELLGHVNAAWQQQAQAISFRADFTAAPIPNSMLATLSTVELLCELYEVVAVQGLVAIAAVSPFLDQMPAAEQLAQRMLHEGVLLNLLEYATARCNGAKVVAVRGAAPAAHCMLFDEDAGARTSYFKFFFNFFNSEMFLMRRDAFFPPRSRQRDLFVAVTEHLVTLHFKVPAVSNLPSEIKKELRPLLDMILRLK